MNPGLVVKLRPSGPWRIGPDSGARNRVDVIYHSDSLYSAVTAAMSRLGWLEEWLDATARTGAPSVSFSSCFPYLDNVVFVVPPRTAWPPASPSTKAARVRWKSARFIPLTVVQSILAGERLDENSWSVDGPSDCLVPAGKPGPFRTAVRSSACVDRLTGASERHSIACLEFRAGSGLWTVVSFEDEKAHEKWSAKVKAAFRLLADTGFGGERSRGWGRSDAPEFTDGMLPDLILPLRAESAAAAEPLEPAEAAAVAAPAPELMPAPEAPAEQAVEAVEAKVAEAAPPADEVVAIPTLEAPTVESGGEAKEVAPEASALPAPQEPEAEPEEGSEAAVRFKPDIAPFSMEKSTEPEPGDAPARKSEAPDADAPTATSGSAEPPTPEPAVLPEETTTAAATEAHKAEADVASVPEAPAESPVAESQAPAAEITPAADAPATPLPVPEVPVIEAPAVREPEASTVEPATAQAPAAEPDAPIVEAPAAESETAAVEAAPAIVAAPTHPHWLLSLFTPAQADSVDWRRGNYTVLPRGGRVDSPAGSGELKKQIQMLAEGSVVYAETAPRGSAADVAPDGFAHPVFRAGFAVAIPLPEVR